MFRRCSPCSIRDCKCLAIKIRLTRNVQECIIELQSKRCAVIGINSIKTGQIFQNIADANIDVSLSNEHMVQNIVSIGRIYDNETFRN